MIISVASGKGGTGKTTVATSLALSLAETTSIQFLDCDVEAPNAHIMLEPDLQKFGEVNQMVPEVDKAACTLCGRCAEVCQFNAIAVVGEKVLIFPDICHGCGSCTLNCPENAIHEVPFSLGKTEAGTTSCGIDFAHGLLNVGQPIAVPIITNLKSTIDTEAFDLTILDSPPGSSCPVVETIRDTDFVILVTEPTPFGLHDLRLAYEVARLLGVPVGVILNRDGVGNADIEGFCDDKDIPLLMRIPLREDIAAGLASGKPLIEIDPAFTGEFIDLYTRIQKYVEVAG